MIVSSGAIWSLKKCNPIVLYCVFWQFHHGVRVRYLHSSIHFEQNRPIRPRIDRHSKKSIKHEVDKENGERKVLYRNTIRSISNILRYSTWESAQQQLENLTIKWDSYTINQVLKTHPPMEKAWLFFNWASRLKGFKHDQFTYTTMLDIFGEAGRISSMNYVFDQMQEKGIKIDAVTHTSLLHWLSKDGDVNGSVKLWEEMKERGCFPTVVSYTAYMKVLFDHSRVKEATEVYKEMIEAGCVPNCYTYTVLMEHLAGTGKFIEALEIFSKMQDAGVQPDKAACNILVEKCCHAGETWAMTKILQHMKENFLVLRKSVYMEALKTLTRAGKSTLLLRQANRHFSIQYEEEITVGSPSPAADTYAIDQTFVVDFLRRRNFAAVDCLISNMMEENIRLDGEVLSDVIKMCTDSSRLGGALLAFGYGKKMGIAIDRTAYLSLVGLLVRTRSFPKVVEIVEEMVRNEISLGTHLSALLIYRLGCSRKLSPAIKVFDLLTDEERSTTAYTALIAAFFASRKTSKGLETFKSMGEKGVSVSLGTYNVLLAGLEKSGRVGEEVDFYRREKKRLHSRRLPECHVSSEEMTCNLLFARDM